MNSLILLVAISSQVFLQKHLFWANGRQLMLGNRVVASPERGDIFVSPDMRYAAVYDFDAREIQFYAPDGSVTARVYAINPVIKIDEGGDFAVFEPEIAKFRVFSPNGEPVIDQKLPYSEYTDEPYAAFDISFPEATFAMTIRGYMHIWMWDIEHGKLLWKERIASPSTYPAHAWIAPDGQLIVRIYSVKNGEFAGDQVVVYSPDGKKIAELPITGATHIAFNGDEACIASKRDVFRVSITNSKAELMDSVRLDGFIKDVRFVGGRCVVLTATPDWAENKVVWKNPALWIVDNGKSQQIAGFEGTTVWPVVLEDNGEPALWIPSHGIILKQGGER